MKKTNTIIYFLPVFLSWLFIIGLPLIIFLLLKHYYPNIRMIVDLAVSLVAFLFCFLVGEHLLRILKGFILGDDRSVEATLTPEQHIANLISDVLTHESLRFSKVSNLLKLETKNQVCIEGLTILINCVDTLDDAFDQKLIQLQWLRLVEIMNILREL